MHKKFGKRLLSVTMSVLVALNFCGCGSTEGVAAQEMEPVVEDNTSDLETDVTESDEEDSAEESMEIVGAIPYDYEQELNIIETKNPVFSMLSSVKCRNSQEINDFSTLSDTLFYPLSQNQKYLQSGFHPNPEGYRKSTVRLDNC